jgi:excisionase family DNA binding protein
MHGMGVLSTAEVAELTGLHIETVRVHLRSGRLDSKRIGRVYLIEQSAVRRWLATKPNRGRPKKKGKRGTR